MIWLLFTALIGCNTDDVLDTSGLPVLGLQFEELRVQGNLRSATDMVFISEDELLIASKSGEVGHFRLTDDRVEELGSFTLPGVFDELDCGLISLAAAPDFATTGHLYAGMCTSVTHSGVFRFTFDRNYDAVPATTREVLVLGDADASNPWHNIGSLAFDDEGWLWLPFGDKTVRGNGQDTNTGLGAILRIRPTESGYETHPDAPVAATPEMWAWGVRSPWRGVFDIHGHYWFGDVGAAGAEEINVVTTTEQNFGWARQEGPCESNCDGLTDPVVSWLHEGLDDYQLDDPDVVPTAARVAYVGPQYSGNNDRYQGFLDDTLVFGDFCQGFVRGLTIAADGTAMNDRPLGHLDHPVGWVEGDDGYLYATTFGACETGDSGRVSARLYRALPLFQ